MNSGKEFCDAWKKEDDKYFTKKIYPYLRRYDQAGRSLHCPITRSQVNKMLDDDDDNQDNEGENAFLGNSDALLHFLLEKVDELKAHRVRTKMQNVIATQRRMMAYRWAELRVEEMRLNRLRIEIGQRYQALVERKQEATVASEISENTAVTQRHKAWMALADCLRHNTNNQENLDEKDDPITSTRRFDDTEKKAPEKQPTPRDYYKACFRFLADWYDKGEPWHPFLCYYDYKKWPVPPFSAGDREDVVYYAKDCLGRTWRMQKVLDVLDEAHQANPRCRRGKIQNPQQLSEITNLGPLTYGTQGVDTRNAEG